jgi:hypothetical protein
VLLSEKISTMRKNVNAAVRYSEDSAGQRRYGVDRPSAFVSYGGGWNTAAGLGLWFPSILSDSTYRRNPVVIIDQSFTSKTQKPKQTKLRQGLGIRSVLNLIDSQGMRILRLGKPWEKGMIEIEIPDGLTLSELRLIDDWIMAWRTRIIKADGLKSSS